MLERGDLLGKLNRKSVLIRIGLAEPLPEALIVELEVVEEFRKSRFETRDVQATFVGDPFWNCDAGVT